uniref:YqaJ viral recombinase domain-containing protein n=1 Tax=Daphnia galeata TaxID=27404 RepID=A0A8J2RAW6_9CRUS|nr:unnamed protein product [Daphnia galeata]
MTVPLCQEASECTIEQKDSAVWRRLRYLRITASNLHSVAHCKTTDGSLVDILHGAQLRETAAMARGTRLESQVLEVVSRQLKISFQRCGLICVPQHPIFSASPDAINHTFTVEIKCPSNARSYYNFIDASGKITSHCNAQVQLQMHLSGRKKALFCVASPQFEKIKKVKILLINYDEMFITNVMMKALDFWKRTIGKFVLQ